MSQLVKYKIGSNFLGAVVHFCNPSTLEAEAGGLQFQGQHGLHSEKLSQKSKCNLLHCKDNICCKLENTLGVIIHVAKLQWRNVLQLHDDYPINE
jgi:hypothetical protein